MRNCSNGKPVPGVAPAAIQAGRAAAKNLARRLQGEPTRAGLMAQLTGGSYDFGGFSLNYGPNNNRGSDAVYLTVIGPDGKFKPVTHIA